MICQNRIAGAVSYIMAALVAVFVLTATTAWAQSSSSVSVNGVEITITGGRSQSISSTSTGAEIMLDGRTIIIDGTTISVDGSSFDSGPFESIEIEVDGDTLRILVDGELRMETTTTASSGDGEELTDAAKMNNKGVAYYRGEGVEQSYEKAVEFYMKAVELGSTVAADNLVSIYWYGVDGIPEDEALAVEYAQIALPDEHPTSTYVMGIAYLDAISVAQDIDRAVDLLNKAGDAGESDALNRLGVEYSTGDMLPQDHDRSTEYYRRAAEMGNFVAQSNYAWALWEARGTEMNAAEALRYALLSAERDNTTAIYLAGVIYYFAEDPAIADKSRAAEMFLRAAEAGHASGAFNISVMYRDGEAVPKDLDKAITWMEAAVERGYEEAPAELERLKEAKAEAGAPALPEEAIWWYASGQQQIGPMTLSQLKSEMAAGKFGPDGLVWRKGMADWVAAGSVAELAQ